MTTMQTRLKGIYHLQHLNTSERHIDPALKVRVLTEFVEALSRLGDLSGAPLQLTLQPLAQVQDANDPPQQVAGHLGWRETGGGVVSLCGKRRARAMSGPLSF